MVPSDDPSFGGTIITNFGGPGAPGTLGVQLRGRNLQNITEGEKHYEILGFDPRGIGQTTPKADCFGKGHGDSRVSWVQKMVNTVGGVSNSVLLSPCNQPKIKANSLPSYPLVHPHTPDTA